MRAADRSAVEDYGLSVMNIGTTSPENEGIDLFHPEDVMILLAQPKEVVDGWKHPEGITRVTMPDGGGDMRIHVEPHSSTGLGPVIQFVEVDPAAPPRLTIALPEAVEQPIRVVHADGSPAAGTRVELIDNLGEPVPPAARVLALDSGFSISEFHGIQIDATRTDADGRCTVTGPADRPLTIRCFGAHPPLVENGVLLAENERELRLASGATVTIRIEPSDVPARWRRTAGLPPSGAIDAAQADSAPRVGLRRWDHRHGETFPVGSTGEGIPCGDDGVAVLRGVPVGTWQVTCRWQDGELAGPRPLETLPGGTHEFILDASAYRVGSVSGRLTVAGGASTGAQLLLRRTLDRTDPDGSPVTESRSIETGRDGSFATELAVGTWSVFGSIHLPETADRGAEWAQVRVHPDIVVLADREHTVELRAEVARTELRVIDPAGDPVAGLQFWVIHEDWLDLPAIAATDADGRSIAEGEPGSYRVACRIRSLTSEEAFERALQTAAEAHGGDWDAAGAAFDPFVGLPDPIPLPAPSGRVVEIRLPKSWDR